MRKFQALSLSAALLASLLLGGCANNAASSDAASSDSAASEPEATPEPTPAPPAANPLTGAADADYTGKRPVAVTLRNMTGSTPQWGIASADVLVEGRDRGHHCQPDGAVRQPGQHRQGRPRRLGPRPAARWPCPPTPCRCTSIKTSTPATCSTPWPTRTWTATTSARRPSAFDQDRQNAGYAEENCWYTTAELINSGLASYGVSLNGDNTPLFQFGERPAVDPCRSQRHEPDHHFLAGRYRLPEL